ncbi:hypothetical protein ASPZODRAFT_127125 [Penicilliopsis zonata CBS 506.65]|uniref:Box C/D snoRNA protein 1 n=1 Tax=Penicilliopsis zonata CBS 506.65 TaxID=1073090 RepID=A0A1L9SV54_9EURO|nr:hypothetical protein ASPZODRAFT_127125 [Penicilliopsis zonata CBS 506.65]OJJ51112.1 hypothetical protein ASPZODRAFT_127125 [Penicilliopsis zonata CBS 506.65]
MAESSETDAVLSSLCTICHTNTPKYRCPRCSTQTCSLACSRRHKLWSQCSGVRDPAAYLRRNELATESAFDRDFNFITGIERRLERAERDVENRGIPTLEDHAEGTIGGKRKRTNEPRLAKGEVPFLRGAESAGVTVVRAPKGMSRSKMNASRWFTKQKCLNWTVEWVFPTGEKKLNTSLEGCTIAEAYARVNPVIKGTKDEEPPSEQSQAEPNPEAAPAQSTTVENQTHSTCDGSLSEAPPTSTASHPPISHRDVYFYLHRPQTSTKQPVLVPLQPHQIFTTVLRNRTVLEFPTIYALSESPETLRTESEDPARFLLEEEYLHAHKPGEEDPDSVPEKSENEAEDAGVDLETVDEEKVLEVLQRDLGEDAPTVV